MYKENLVLCAWFRKAYSYAKKNPSLINKIKGGFCHVRHKNLIIYNMVMQLSYSICTKVKKNDNMRENKKRYRKDIKKIV